MANQYSDKDLLNLYEGDQSKLYSGILHKHDDDYGSDKSKTKIKRIVTVTVYLAIVTILEVSLGLWDHHTDLFASGKGWLNAIFLIMTMAKAYLIVDVFMHLGDEFRNFVMMVLIPLILLTWIIIAFSGEGDYWLNMSNTNGLDKIEQTTKP